MLNRFIDRERSIVYRDLIDLSFEGWAAFCLTADGEPARPSEWIDLDREVDLGPAVAVEVDGDPSTVADKRYVVPGLGCDLSLTRVILVVRRASGEE